jgi:hypothetical protein
MSEVSIESSLAEMLQSLKTRCPNLCPAIFPSRFCPKTLTDLCENDHQRRRVAKWEASNGTPNLRYETVIDINHSSVAISAAIDEQNETDSLLGNLEAMMALLVTGTEEELQVARSRFLQVNNQHGDKDLGHRLFVETYSIAYAIKVLISNMPIQLKISRLHPGTSASSQSKALKQEHLFDLPLDEDTKIEALLNNIVQQRHVFGQQSQSKSSGSLNGKKRSDSNTSTDEESEEEEEQQSKKPRKKKRSGKK